MTDFDPEKLVNTINRMVAEALNERDVRLGAQEERIKALEDWRNRTIWGYQPQTLSLSDKPITDMSIWELVTYASHAYTPRGDMHDVSFRERAVKEIEHRIEEAFRPAPTPEPAQSSNEIHQAIVQVLVNYKAKLLTLREACDRLCCLDEATKLASTSEPGETLYVWLKPSAFNAEMFGQATDAQIEAAAHKLGMRKYIVPPPGWTKTPTEEEYRMLDEMEHDEPASRIDDTSRICRVCELPIPEGETLGWIATQAGNRNMCVACLGQASRVYANTQRLSCVLCGKTSEAPNSGGWSRVIQGKIVCNECCANIKEES